MARWFHWSGAWSTSISITSKLMAPDLELLGPQAVTGGLLGIFRHQLLEIGLGALMLPGRPGGCGDT